MTPAPGIYENIPAEVYHQAWEAASSSRLKLFARSPAHMREGINNPPEPTPALLLGDAAHVSILQPNLFEERYVVSGTCEARKKDGAPCSNPGKWMIGGEWRCGVHVKADRHADVLRAIVDSYQAQGFTLTKVSEFGSNYLDHEDGRKVRVANHPASITSKRRMFRDGREDIRADLPPYGNDDPRQVVSQESFDACRRMADAVRAHRAARDLLDGRRQTELSALWRCPETKVLCKLRADGLCDWDSTPIVADLKTTEDASRDAFERSVWSYRYFCQAAHYTSGLAAHGKIYDHFCIIAVEKEPPHAVAVYRITDDVMAIGREEVLSLLRRYGKCVESGVWPAYPEEIQDLGIPKWAMRQLEQVA